MPDTQNKSQRHGYYIMLMLYTYTELAKLILFDRKPKKFLFQGSKAECCMDNPYHAEEVLTCLGLILFIGPIISCGGYDNYFNITIVPREGKLDSYYPSYIIPGYTKKRLISKIKEISKIL